MKRTIAGLGFALVLSLGVAAAPPSQDWGPDDAHIGSLVSLCLVIDCWKLLHYPVIEAVLLNNIVEPGETIILGGSWFGTSADNFAGGTIMLSNGAFMWVELSKAFWADGAVAAKVPKPFPTAFGDEPFPDQWATLRVIRADGTSSNAFPVFFKAEREIRALQYNEPAVKLTSCGDDGNYDSCNKIVDDGETPVFWQFGTGCFSTLCGVHENSWGAIGDDTGTDHYQITLKNGWVFEDIEMSTYKSSTNEIIQGPTPSLPIGGTSWSPQFSWTVTPNDRAVYTVSVFIKGPKGTSPQ